MVCSLEKIEHDILFACNKLRENVGCDFTGLALQKQSGLDITWPFVSGNRNEKFKYITVRYGKGIAGKVIGTNRSMQIDDFPSHINGKSTDYPIMLAEKMVAAFAVPLQLKGIPKGSLLIGYRKAIQFKEDDYNKVKQTANEIEALLPLYFLE
ncbi:GAF domain-containing protein [Virgibacillus byunsanensis]|uniref:GAF domain-containing protein n=1 Tax=Virgibacillus byunsanensis TaxID=570945 RepID=A0ABW3LH81_9BACI